MLLSESGYTNAQMDSEAIAAKKESTNLPAQPAKHEMRYVHDSMQHASSQLGNCLVLHRQNEKERPLRFAHEQVRVMHGLTLQAQLQRLPYSTLLRQGAASSACNAATSFIGVPLAMSVC